MPAFQRSWKKFHRRKKSGQKLFAVAIFLFITLAFAFPRKYDLVIKNGRIADGSGKPWFYADLGIINGAIAKIGRIEASDAAQIIDAKNLTVAPGFILKFPAKNCGDKAR